MTSVPKNVYIDKLNDIVRKYNNTYHTSIKMKPVDVKDNTYIDFKKESNDKDPKFKVGDHVRVSKYKNIFAKGYVWTYVINDLNGEEIIGNFYENELQGTKQNEFRIEKVIKRKGDKLYVKWKDYDNSFNSWIDKKTLDKMSRYFPEPYEPFGGDINVKVDLSNYARKAYIKNITHVDTSSFALKTNLASLKTEVNKLDIDKLVYVPADLCKLSNVVNNQIVKKTEYDKLVTKVNNIDTGGFILKTKNDADQL